MKAVIRIAVVALSSLVIGCSGWQSSLDPKGPQARELSDLMWFIIIVCTLVWALVMLVLAMALLHRRRPRTGTVPRSERRIKQVIGVALLATLLIITSFTVASFVVTQRIDQVPDDALTLEVVAHQWWWEIRYRGQTPDQGFTTANEIHVPLGRPVRVILSSPDVIHSFWVPSLIGKLDMIPGRDNTLVFTATEPGTYRGQCAEFCGIQHARMAFLVKAESVEDFDVWQQGQRLPGAAPTSPTAREGLRVLQAKACTACHTVRGTDATGTLGPDLTHVASRSTLAAGLLENSRGSLAAWLADPQTIKPGNNMPMVPLSADELNALSAYLESLR